MRQALLVLDGTLVCTDRAGIPTLADKGYQGAGADVVVEVARLNSVIGLRDSKAPDAGHLVLSAEVLAGLVGSAKWDDLYLT